MKKLISLALCFSIANILLSPLAYAQNKDYSGKTLLDAYKLAGDMKIEMNIPQHYAENQKKQETSEKLDYKKLDGDIPVKFETIFNKAFTKKEETGEYAADNTERLGGILANNFLKKSSPCTDSQVVLGVNDAGTPICGDKNNNLFVKIRIHSGSITAHWPEWSKEWERAKKNGIQSTTQKWVRNSVNRIVREETLKKWGTWYEVNGNTQFIAPEEVEVVFEDDSLIRLAANSSIYIDPKAFSDYDKRSKEIGISNSIAQITYDRGLIWGRVLNEGIVKFNHNHVIAGVRWTSIMMDQFGIHAVHASDKNQDLWRPIISLFQRDGLNTKELNPVGRCTTITGTNTPNPTIKTLSGNGLGFSKHTCASKGLDSRILENSRKDAEYLRRLYTDRRDNVVRLGDDQKNDTRNRDKILDSIGYELSGFAPTSIIKDQEMKIYTGGDTICADKWTRNIMWSHMRITDPEVMCRDEKTVGMIVFDNGVPTVYVRDESADDGVSSVWVQESKGLNWWFYEVLNDPLLSYLNGVSIVPFLSGNLKGKIFYNKGEPMFFNGEILQDKKVIQINDKIYLLEKLHKDWCDNNKGQCTPNQLQKVNGVLILEKQ